MSNMMVSAGSINFRETLKLLARAFRYVFPYKWQFALKTLLQSISLLPMLIMPWLLKILVDHAILRIPVGESPTRYPPFVQPFLNTLAELTPGEIIFATLSVSFFFILLVGRFGGRAQMGGTSASLTQGTDTATRTENEANTASSLVGGLFGLLEYRIHLRVTQRLNHFYRSQLFERVQSLPMTVFDDEKIGDAVYRVMYDTPSLTDMCFKVILIPVVSAVNIALTLYLLDYSFSAVPIVVYAAFAFAPAYLITTLPLAGPMRRRGELSREAGSDTTSTMEEGMGNVLAVQSLGGARREEKRFDKDSRESYSKYRSAWLLGLWAWVLGAAIAVSLFCVVFFAVLEAVINGTFTIGDFNVLIAYYFQIFGSTLAIGTIWTALQGNAAGLRRVFFLMDMPGEKDLTGRDTIDTISKGVTMENVSYTYPDGTRALKDIDLKADIGEVVAFVGPTGAGKTSLAYLIPRFMDADEGSVRIDGKDTREMLLDSLRSKVTFVFQEGMLFADTIEENIRMGKPDATDMEVRQAAKASGADEFILELPEGYKTKLGRSGGTLSVGQKQRLSIARGLVRNAPILILDEPTSALDPETEMNLVRALHEASRTSLVIIIAHRLSTIRTADKIFFMQEGEILEQGSHDELMAKEGGHYRHFVELQTRGAA